MRLFRNGHDRPLGKTIGQTSRAAYTNHFSSRPRQPLACRHHCRPTWWFSSLPIATVHESHSGHSRPVFKPPACTPAIPWHKGTRILGCGNCHDGPSLTDTVEKGFSTSAPLWTRGSDSSICTFWGKVRFSKWDPMGTRFYPFPVLSDVRAHFLTVSTRRGLPVATRCCMETRSWVTIDQITGGRYQAPGLHKET